MKTTLTVAVAIACLVAAAPARAQGILASLDDVVGASGVADSVALHARYLEFQPPTQRGGGGSGLLWTGLAVTVAGGVLAGLSNNVLASDTHYQRHECIVPEFDIPCTETNQGVLWTGVAVAGAGITMAIIGKARQRSSLTFTPLRGGAAVSRRFSF